MAETTKREQNILVIVVGDRSTGTVLDQYPPEDVLRMLNQLSASEVKQTGKSRKERPMWSDFRIFAP